MRALLSAACLLVTAVSVHSQTVVVRPGNLDATQTLPPRDRTAQEAVPTGTGVIRGRVVVADTGEPVRRAFVNVMGRGPGLRRSISTDEQGRFEFRELPKGEFWLSASKSGYITVQFGQRGPQEPGRPIQLADGEVYERALIALPRGGVIAGRITDEYGDPIADAMVSALQHRWTGGRRMLIPSRMAQTNDLGQFRLHGLPPGEYVVSSIYRGGGMFGPVEDAGTTGYAPTYYPGTPNAAEAAPITVRVGDETSAEFQLMAMRLARIQGIVLDGSGKPGGTETMLMAAPKDSAVGGMAHVGSGTRVEADGTFTIGGLAPGVYHITATTRFGLTGEVDGDPQSATTEVSVAGGDVEGITLTLGPGATATGHVVIEGDPAAIRPGSLSIMTRPRDVTPGRDFFVSPGRVKDDLGFELKGLFGTRLLMVSGLPPNWYLKSVLLGGSDVTDSGVTTDGARRITGLQVVISDRPPLLTGGVTDARGTPVHDFTVVAFAEDPERWTLPNMRYVRPARSDQQGRFRIEGLPAGRYLVVALEFADTSELMNPDVLRRLSDDGTPIVLSEGETRAVQLTISRQGG
jgi:hypothetical protein